MSDITRKLAIFGCLLFTSFCFWKAGAGLIGGADTEILPSAQAAISPSFSPPRVVTTPIQQVRPGMRIVGRNPLRIQTESTIDPTPEGWRLVSVRMLKADGAYFEAELLRPLSWIYRHHAQPGAVIQLNMPEMYVVGAAEVLSISDCPPIDPGDGPVVISTFKNVSHNVLNLYVEGETEPIGVTAGHPIWSEDRQAFVHTDQLQPGERLRSAVGKTVRITSIEIRAGPEPVYNLEIAGEHVYSVTGSGLLVHNSGPCDLVPRGYYDSGYIGIVNGSAYDFSDTLSATFGTSDVLPSSRLVSQADTVGGIGFSASRGGLYDDISFPSGRYTDATLDKYVPGGADYAIFRMDERLMVNMPRALPGQSQNAAGYLRDAQYYWKELYKKYPEAFSEQNIKILNGLVKSRNGNVVTALKNDATFRAVFKQYDVKYLRGKSMVHHHVGGEA
ncbi:hypothetical protein Mal35_20010 [Gimesia maris]|uniref:polymorphic toxin-type HINT domain-containing protein n=1 Tax=Gimesia maris TaxID=122 RepID=UPI001187828C|nr:polymorphic toxin-type HINT domain-containing protein [Gimesia maris]QDT78552.1 hypothetical protein Mal35_20010 [Gimesia maris]